MNRRGIAVWLVLTCACSSSPPPTPLMDVGPSDVGFMSAPHLAFPQIPCRGGSEIDGLRLVIVAASGDPLASSFFAFGDALLASTWLTTVGAGYGLTHESTPSIHVIGPAMPASVGFREL